MNYRSVRQFSKMWNVGETKITYYCRSGKIPGSVKQGKEWFIPENSSLPSSCRSHNMSAELRPLPIGVSDFREMSEKYYYIDKTLMIKDIIDTLPKVSLFTRPRRFGKTLNMDMLKVFFEKTCEDTSVYFKDKLIWNCGEKYRNYQGKYPVIFLSFKDIKYDTYEDAVIMIKSLFREELKRHQEIMERLNDYDHLYCNKILDESAGDVDLAWFLARLSRIFYDIYKTRTVIIIDEYDTPIQQGYIKGYYDKIILFMRNLFSGGFKDNSYLEFGFMTGILRVAKESIFSGMNNLRENSVLTERFSGYFGFTGPEVSDVLTYYGIKNKLAEICEWYDGYVFGSTEIFNPWSVLNYIDSGCMAAPYWKSTGSNDIIKQIVSYNSEDVRSFLETLLTGKTITADIDTSVIYPEIKSSPMTLFSFLLMSGYLKTVKKINTPNGMTLCEACIPNKEVMCIYGSEILASLGDAGIQSSAVIIQNAVINKDTDMLKNELRKFLKRTVSYYDTGSESFYQGLMIGIYAAMNNLYVVQSNREAGDGRFDIQMYPADGKMNKTGILIELKVLPASEYGDGNSVSSELLKLSSDALKQIDDRNYHQNLIDLGMKNILKYGIAFCKKNVEISFAEEEIV